MYQKMILKALDSHGLAGRVDPRHVEAWMRMEYPSLDALSPEQFQDEVLDACKCAMQAGEKASETLARTLGL